MKIDHRIYHLGGLVIGREDYHNYTGTNYVIILRKWLDLQMSSSLVADIWSKTTF